MSTEDIIDGLAIIQQKRGRIVDQGDVEMLALAIKELRKGRAGSGYVHDESKAVDLLRRIAKANVIFPSMCANNMDAWNLCEELKAYSRSDISSRTE